MGWELGRYYTRSRRVNGRVVRAYVGGGSVGRRAAAADRRRRALAAARRRAEEARRADLGELEALSRGLEVEVRLIVRAAAVLGGCYVHGSELRARAR